MALHTENFLSYRGYRWFWINALMLAVFAAWYMLDKPIGVPNGGTWFGYVSGGVAAAGILFLMWYAVRRRGYHARWTSLLGCLSFHAWLGLALLFLVPLHAGFQLGMNIHSAAYLVMIAVIMSGTWGAMRYLTVAPTIESHRGGSSVRTLGADLLAVDSELDSLVKEGPSLGGLRDAIDAPFEPRFWRLVLSNDRAALDVERVSGLLASLPAEERDKGLELVRLIDKKRDLERRMKAELRAITKLRLWLTLHVPLSLILVSLVCIHVFVVWYYRG